MGYLGLIIPIMALTIPIIAITLRHSQKNQLNKNRELELKKEILELEIQKQNGKIRLLEEENKKLDKIINNEIQYEEK